MKKLEDYVINIPDFPKPGIIFRDITSILRDPEGLKLSVHELMHCVIPLFGSEDETYHEAVANVYTERQIELIARSLMKAKYNLEMEDFYKQPSEDDEGCENK